MNVDMNASNLRKEIIKSFNELAKIKEGLITRKPMARGTVYELKRKCGKKNCKCMKGELHKQMCIAVTEKGKTKLRFLKREEIERMEKLTGFYRRLRKTRVRFIKTTQRIVKLTKQLEEEMIKIGQCQNKNKR